MFQFTLRLLFAFLATTALAQNRSAGPYVADADTLHLWHLDESAAPAADAGTNPFPLRGLLNQATLGNAAAPGLGTALNTHTGTASAYGILALQPVLAANALDNAPANFVWFGPNGAFTLEALVKLETLPANAPGGALDIITMEGDSSERVFSFRIEKSAAPALNFLVLPNSGVFTTAQSFSASIPLSGAHALATNVWFHVAVTYNGNAGAGNNLALYWTRLDSGAVAANLIGSSSLPADFTATNGDFALGNDARSASGENEVFPGQIDEVCISGVARTAANFLFRGVALAGASGSDGNLPENTLDANFGTRWSASGDGQWIAYDLGATRAVSGVNIAFYSGNTRSTTFDVLVSTDNATWQTVLTRAVSSGTTTNLEWFGFASVPARFVRLVGHGNSVSDWNSLTEVVIGLADGGDLDHDGLPDSWELFYFGNLAQGATGDPDADGLNNLHEFQNGLIPRAGAERQRHGWRRLAGCLGNAALRQLGANRQQRLRPRWVQQPDGISEWLQPDPTQFRSWRSGWRQPAGQLGGVGLRQPDPLGLRRCGRRRLQQPRGDGGRHVPDEWRRASGLGRAARRLAERFGGGGQRVPDAHQRELWPGHQRHFLPGRYSHPLQRLPIHRLV